MKAWSARVGWLTSRLAASAAFSEKARQRGKVCKPGEHREVDGVCGPGPSLGSAPPALRRRPAPALSASELDEEPVAAMKRIAEPPTRVYLTALFFENESLDRWIAVNAATIESRMRASGTAASPGAGPCRSPPLRSSR